MTSYDEHRLRRYSAIRAASLLPGMSSPRRGGFSIAAWGTCGWQLMRERPYLSPIPAAVTA